MQESLPELITSIRACRICEPHLPLGANPVLQAQASARVLLVGQAPGTRVHETGIPWNDASGERLRAWLGVDNETFYDDSRFAIVPMGFCYPGKGKSGDLPPRKECAGHWRARIHALLPNIELTVLIGQYAMQFYLQNSMKATLTETIRAYREYAPQFFPLVHPSPRNQIWLKKNGWFERDLIPELRRAIQGFL